MTTDILNSFRQLWLDYTDPHLSLVCSFTLTSIITPSPSIWLSKDVIYSSCSKCKTALIIVCHCNFNNIYFTTFITELTYLVCYCSQCESFCILTSNIHIPAPINSLQLSKLRPFIDTSHKIYTVPIVNPNICAGCENNLIMAKIYSPCVTESTLNSVKYPIDRVKYSTHYSYKQCKCYSKSTSQLIMSFKGSDCEVLYYFEILALEVSKCNLCNYLNFDIYSHKLDISPSTGYNLDMYSYANNFYHIINSTDLLNGVVIKTSYDINESIAICKAIEYSKEGDNIDYTSIRKIDTPTTKLLTTKFDFAIENDNLTVITSILK